MYLVQLVDGSLLALKFAPSLSACMLVAVEIYKESRMKISILADVAFYQ